MANRVEIEVSADTKQAEKGIGGIREQLEGISKPARTAGLALSAMGAAGAAFFGLALKSAIEERQGIEMLNSSLQRLNTSYGEQQKQIEGVISALQRKTNYSDEEQRLALQKLIDLSGSYTNSLKALPLALDLAAALHLDLESAVTMLGKGLSGNITLFTKYYKEIKEGATPTELLAFLTDKVGDSATAAANPLKQLTNTLDDLRQTMVQGFLPAIFGVVEGLNKWLQGLMNTNPEAIKTAGIILLIGTAFATIAGPLLLFVSFLPSIIAGITVLGSAIVAMTTTSALAFGGWVALFAVVAAAYIFNLGGMRDKTNSALGGMAKQWGWFSDIVSKALFFTAGAIVEGINSIIKLINGMMKFFSDAVNGFIIGLNLLITSINKVSGVFGGKQIGAIPFLNAPQIPELMFSEELSKRRLGAFFKTVGETIKEELKPITNIFGSLKDIWDSMAESIDAASKRFQGMGQEVRGVERDMRQLADTTAGYIGGLASLGMMPQFGGLGGTIANLIPGAENISFGARVPFSLFPGQADAPAQLIALLTGIRYDLKLALVQGRTIVINGRELAVVGGELAFVEEQVRSQ